MSYFTLPSLLFLGALCYFVGTGLFFMHIERNNQYYPTIKYMLFFAGAIIFPMAVIGMAVNWTVVKFGYIKKDQIEDFDTVHAVGIILFGIMFTFLEATLIHVANPKAIAFAGDKSAPAQVTQCSCVK